MSPESYCRDLEAYLCRKNDGHLIRITGPAFERVSRWAEEGIPLTVACAGIDRYFERYYRKGPRRRPVRVEFCEPDVLDAFDDWRRAVGVAQPQGPGAVPRTRVSLASHLERTIARLTTLRASSQRAHVIDAALADVARALDHLLPAARTVRGAAREALLTTLAALDRDMMAAAMAVADPEMLAAAAADAKVQLEPFRDRMASDAYEQAARAAAERHVREFFGLPALPFP